MTLDASTAELEIARKIFWLLTQDAVFLSSYNGDTREWDEGAYPAINCNDLFVPGADAESLSAEDLDTYIEVVKKYPIAGYAAWCAVKRSSKLWRRFSPDTPTMSKWGTEYNAALFGIAEILKVDPPLDLIIKPCAVPSIHESTIKVPWWKSLFK